MIKAKIRNLTILFGSTMSVLASTVLAPALPEMSRAFQDMPNSDFMVRLVLTFPALFIALSAPFTGILLDRWGRKPVIAVALILYAVSGSAGFFNDSLAVILVSRAFLGLAISGTISGFTTLIIDYFSGQRLNQFMGYQGAFIGFGGMVSFLAGGFLADVSWQHPFLIHLFAMIILPGLLLTVDEPENVRKVASLKRGSFRKELGPSFNKIIMIYITALLGMMIFFVFPIQIPFLLREISSISLTHVGLILSVPAFAAVIMSLLYRRLKEKLSFNAILFIIFIALALNHLFLYLFSELIFIVIGLIFGGLAVGLLPPNLNVWIASLIPSDIRGRAIGGLTMSFFFGQFLTPIVAEPLVSDLGIQKTFLFYGLFSLAISILFLLSSVNKREESS